MRIKTVLSICAGLILTACSHAFVNEGAWEVTHQELDSNFCEGFDVENTLNDVFPVGMQFEVSLSDDGVEITFPNGELETLTCSMHDTSGLYGNKDFRCSISIEDHIEQDEHEVQIGIDIIGENYVTEGQDITYYEAMNLRSPLTAECPDCGSFGEQEWTNCLSMGMGWESDAWHNDAQ